MTQFQDLLAHPKAPKIKGVFNFIWGMFLVAMLFSTGGMTGYWWRDNIANQRRTEMRRDHLAEIKRLTEAYGRDVTALSGNTAEAANAAAAAAAAVEEASVTANTAASVATEAAKQSKVAVQQAKTAATVVKDIAKVPEPTRQQVNKNIEDINRRVNK